MADTLEIRLGGIINGRRIATGDVDYSEVHPLIGNIEQAAIIESGISPFQKTGRRAQGEVRKLSPIRLALSDVFNDATNQPTAVYRFVVGIDTAEAVSKITAGLAGQDNKPVVPAAADKIRKGLTRTIGKGLSVQLVNGVTTPVFSLNHPPPDLTVYPTNKFESEIPVRILRVGGRGKILVRVKLLGSGLEATLTLSSEKTARELGNHLYRDAIIRGQGEWVIDPGRFSTPTRLLRFRVASHKLLKPATITTVIKEMTNASGGIWDDIDPTDPVQVNDPPGAAGDLPRQ